MKAKAFLVAALCAMSFSLVACGGANDEAPADMDTTNAVTAPSEPAMDTVAPAPIDTTATSADTASAADTVAK